ncbi:UNVERIFIED_ORG: shikimate kinase [Burkholderia sp. 1263]
MTQTIVLIGFKSCGKSTYGPQLASRMGGAFCDLDRLLEDQHESLGEARVAAHEIFCMRGSAYFAQLEARALAQLGGSADAPGNALAVLATTGATPLTPANLPLLRRLGPLVLLDTPREVIRHRWLSGRLPAFVDPLDADGSFQRLYDERAPRYRAVADAVISTAQRSDAEVLDHILKFARNTLTPPADSKAH